jgi:hypothetical protein
MPKLPERRVGLVACSGEELPEGTVTRLAALRVLENLRRSDTVTICLPLFLAGGESERAFARFYPTIAIDGCDKRCASRATELYSNRPAATILVSEVLAGHGLPPPSGLRKLSPEGEAAVEAVAQTIASEVDRLMITRWSRSQGAVVEAVPVSEQAVNTELCACGSGIPVTTIRVGERMVEILALEPILEMAYNQGSRVSTDLPPQIMQMVHVYNSIPEGEEALYARAVGIAWRAYCEKRS